MNELDKIKDRFGLEAKISGMAFKKWINDNSDVKNYLENILNKEPRYGKLINIVWAIVNNFDINEYKCETCGKKLKIKTVSCLSKFCCTKCAMSSNQVQKKRKATINNDINFWKKRQEKTKQTNIQKYGVEYASQSEDIKDKIKASIHKNLNVWKERNKKIKQTCQLRYGVDNVYQLDSVKEKKKKSYLLHYGVEHPMQSKEIQDKIKQTNLERYGYENPFQDKTNIFKQYWNKILSWNQYIIPLFSEAEFKGKNHIYKWKCVKCNNEFEQKIYNTKFMKSISGYMPRCPFCYPIKKSGKEQIITDFINNLGFNVIRNDRKIIAPYELDIVIPEKKIAIEFNGIYFHSESILHNPFYHLMKTELCEFKGYRLIHIFEHEWDFQQKIIKEKLKAMLGVEQEKVYARKCIVKEISVKEKNEFLNKYHIQGEDKSKIKLGLFYNNELAAVMTFGKPRFNQNYNYELIRYATSKHVLGGAGKLLSYFRKHYPGSIITYADRRFSNGNMYEKLGFTKLKNTEPNYWWIRNNEILSRYQTQKHNLKDILKENFDPNKTEIENMIDNGYYQIFDCGNLIYII